MDKPESERTSPPPNTEENAQIVYRRSDSPDDSGAAQSQTPGGHTLAPAVTPLIIGFTLLLLVISVLGFLSVHRVDEVGYQVLDLDRVHSARANLLLQLRLALTRLDNEARKRQDAESSPGLKPPFDLPLRTAREDMNKSMAALKRPSLSQDPQWSQFGRDLEAYVAITDDSRRYSLEGFSKFHLVDAELNDLFSASAEEQGLIQQQSEAIQKRAARSIRLWSLIALVVGFLVAVGTIWEVQRRFRQMRQSVQAARRERTFSNQMLEGMVSAVAAIDNHDRIRSANRAFFDIFPRASIGALVHEDLGPADARKILETAVNYRGQEARYRGRWVCQSEVPGMDQSFDLYSAPLLLEGDQGQLVTLVDVTEAAEAEAVMRRNESLAAVGRATTQVAHEIRNPLGSIRLGVSMLRDSVGGDEDALRTIDLVERGVNHLNKLVIDVTEFSRQKPLARSDVDLDELLNRSFELVEDKIREKGTPLEKKFRSPSVRGSWDPDQLRQVFVNLIGNAVDASPERASITVTTDVKSGDGPHGTPSASSLARITIADHGSGMDQATIDRIFEPFFSTKKRGTGLGLAIVKQIVEQHDGEISVESTPGEGTRFTVELPL